MTDEELAILARAATILSKHGETEAVQQLTTIAHRELTGRICDCFSIVRDENDRLQCLTHGDVTDRRLEPDPRFLTYDYPKGWHTRID